ncbi:Metallothionein expression activator [Ceratocystis fimbriata CBS 114723]|uniref:Metallothionein expression activator n=1 Tax=Ceratocystis fimbriata CBS 114723 TaxID=1035309 RepID=A0A2C5X4C2_9PEZI|nr:Metallothionein expression activator [Ceratocystis fimbriata CBS 114723]
MISSSHTPASAIHQNRQQLLQERRHKRQQSTPNANFDTIRIAPPHHQQPMAAPSSANLQHHRQSLGHRRGLSLDTRRQVLSNRQSVASATAAAAAAAAAGSVGMGHPTSSPVTTSAHEHRIMMSRSYINLSMEQENYLISPHSTPHSQRFDPASYDTTPIHFDSSFGPDMGLQSAPIAGKGFEFFTTDSPLTTPSFVYAESPTTAGNWMSEGDAQSQSQPQPQSQEESQSQSQAQSQIETQAHIQTQNQAEAQGGFQRHSRRISNGIMDRVTKFETLGMEPPQAQVQNQGQGQSQGQHQRQTQDSTRPTTPTNQNVSSHTQAAYMPPTPMETPQERQDQDPQQQQQQSSQQKTSGSDGSQQQQHDSESLQDQVQTEQQQQVFQQQPQQSFPARFEDGYDESMEETVKPLRKQTARPLTSFDEMRQQAEHASSHSRSQSQSQPHPQPHARGHGHSHSIHSVHSVSHPTMPNTPVKQITYTDPANMSQPPSAGYLNMNNVNAEFLKLQDQYVGVVNADVTHYHHAMMAGMMPAAAIPGMMYHSKSGMNPVQGLSLPDSPLHSRRTSPHRRTDSMASMASAASAASIASINIEETKTETGVTLEDIAQYIQGPEGDNKYSCLFEGCGKRFGRKENIKSHVQTHLNDRQYQCPTCQKCFVRQHDLKRHAKIHTGIKPYPCECGNSFARHDALTRHRQRGMCIGAFDGIVRKVVKRGRPRKKRPDMETRTEKSARTRRKNNLSISSTSSFSSESSGPESPHNDFDIDDDQGFDLMDVALPADCVIPGVGVPMPVSSRSTTSVTNPAMLTMTHDISLSGDYSGTHTVVATPHSYVSPDAILDSVVARSSPHVKSEYNTPPELSKSKSPTPCSRLFESESTPSATGSSVSASTSTSVPASSEPSLPALTSAGTDVPTSTALMDDSLMSTISASGGSSSVSAAAMTQAPPLSDDDMLISSFGNDVLVLDRDTSVMMMDGFEAVSMFPATDDMFFSST